MLYVDLNEKYIIERFPELKEEDYSTNHILKRIFNMYEELSKEGDENTQNLVEVSLLEGLWDERMTYDRALELMGKETKIIWNRIEWLNIPVD